MRILSRFLAASAALCVTLPAMASKHQAGPYISFAGGNSTVSSQVVDSGNDPALGFAIGYRVNPSLAAEVFTRSLSLRLMDGLIGDSNYYPDTHYGVAVIGYLPLHEKLTLSGRVGLGSTKMHSAKVANANYSKTDPSIGVGLSYEITPRWSIGLEATRFTNSHVTTTMANAQFSF